MPALDDHELLAEFARSGCEPAFSALVERYVNLVYSTALRCTGNPHSAEEIAQAVFIILSRKGGKLSSRIVLSGWLYQTTRFTAANFLKGEIRRARREQEAYMQTILDEPDGTAWNEITPLLDEAMGKLGETDRNAVVLRFFENKTAAEVAAKLKLTEPAAHKRVSRALEKLRKIFAKRGVSLTTAILAGAISVNSVHAAPVGLAKTISAVAIAKGATASTSTLTLIKGALKIMAWTKAKTAAVSALVLAGLIITPTVIYHYHEIHKGASLEHWSKNSLANEGYQTPETALKTFLWAMTHADYDACMDSATPEQRARMETDLKNVSREDFTAQMKSKFAPVTGFQVVNCTTASEDVVVIEFHAEGVNQDMKQYTFKKIGNEWKFDQ
jgi:RNA polymerase sigma factor (sigma-70 family)